MTAYSQNFLAAIGLVAVQWSKVEHELKLHASALASQDTDGWPTDDLEIGFKRLRKLWLQKVRKHLPNETPEAERIASKLGALAHDRAAALHGEWRPAKKFGEYAVTTIRQRQTLEFNNGIATPRLLRDVANAIADVHDELRTFTGAKHGP